MADTAAGGTPHRALPARTYTDEKVFAQARDLVHHRTWQPACHASRVPEPGDCHEFSVVGQDLVVVRQKDGSLRCFHNVCQHRGHRLVKEDGRRRFIVCPYHSWSYNLDGSLRSVPGIRDIPGFDKSSVRLAEVRLEMFCGFAFVNLDADSPSLAETHPGVEDAVRAACPGIGELALAHEHSALEQCNWMLAVENYNECYHCKVAHATFASGVVDPQSYNVSASSFPGARCLHHTAKAQSGEGAWYDTSGSGYQSFFLWPSFSLQLYPSSLVNTYHWRPLTHRETRVHRGWYSRDGSVPDEMRKVIDLDRETTFAEDLEILGNVQRGLGSKGYTPGPLVVNPAEGIDSEHPIVALHGWLGEALGDLAAGR